MITNTLYFLGVLADLFFQQLLAKNMVADLIPFPNVQSDSSSFYSSMKVYADAAFSMAKYYFNN